MKPGLKQDATAVSTPKNSDLNQDDLLGMSTSGQQTPKATTNLLDLDLMGDSTPKDTSSGAKQQATANLLDGADDLLSGLDTGSKQPSLGGGQTPSSTF